MRLEIIGRVASKKNQRTGTVKGGKYIVFYSKAWRKFEKESLLQIKNNGQVKSPYDITFTFEMKGKGGNSDLDNCVTSVMDILQKSGVIDNDKNVMSFCANKVLNCKEWKTIVEVESYEVE